METPEPGTNFGRHRDSIKVLRTQQQQRQRRRWPQRRRGRQKLRSDIPLHSLHHSVSDGHLSSSQKAKQKQPTTLDSLEFLLNPNDSDDNDHDNNHIVGNGSDDELNWLDQSSHSRHLNIFDLGDPSTSSFKEDETDHRNVDDQDEKDNQQQIPRSPPSANLLDASLHSISEQGRQEPALPTTTTTTVATTRSPIQEKDKGKEETSTNTQSPPPPPPTQLPPPSSSLEHCHRGILSFLSKIPLLGHAFRRTDRPQDIVLVQHHPHGNVDEEDQVLLDQQPPPRSTADLVVPSIPPPPSILRKDAADTETFSTVSTQLSFLSSSNHHNHHHSSSQSQQPNPNPKPVVKKVQFDVAQFYEHACIPGDNPACSSGIPLTIDWECSQESSRDLSEDGDVVITEVERQPSHNHKGPTTATAADDDHNNNNNKSQGDLYLHPMERELRLRNAGYSRRELQELTRPVDVVRHQRTRTLQTLSLEPWHEAWERTRRSCGKVFLSRHARAHRRKLKKWSSAPSSLGLQH